MKAKLRPLRFLVLAPEAVFWGVALLWLGIFANLEQQAWSLCPLHALGWHLCPGCGLGRSIALALRGQLAASWAMHPLGIPAFLTLFHRIVVLSFPSLAGWLNQNGSSKINLRRFPFIAKIVRHERC
ncbi:MAG: DUF2752 domain-containing protein [Bacteroidetes bacterium]|nr:DUF2752 domain-containing protein [Bacteroidota bacterium]